MSALTFQEVNYVLSHQDQYPAAIVARAQMFLDDIHAGRRVVTDTPDVAHQSPQTGDTAQQLTALYRKLNLN